MGFKPYPVFGATGGAGIGFNVDGGQCGSGFLVTDCSVVCSRRGGAAVARSSKLDECHDGDNHGIDGAERSCGQGSPPLRVAALPKRSDVSPSAVVPAPDVRPYVCGNRPITFHCPGLREDQGGRFESDSSFNAMGVSKLFLRCAAMAWVCADIL